MFGFLKHMTSHEIPQILLVKSAFSYRMVLPSYKLVCKPHEHPLSIVLSTINRTHWQVIFLWFSYGFPMVFLWFVGYNLLRWNFCRKPSERFLPSKYAKLSSKTCPHVIVIRFIPILRERTGRGSVSRSETKLFFFLAASKRYKVVPLKVINGL